MIDPESIWGIYQMSGFEHIPVLFNECISGLNINENGVYADGTAGGGNHALGIGLRLSVKGHLICLDRDIDAIRACSKKLGGLNCTLTLLNDSFTALPVYLHESSLMLDGLLLDLGVSSHQLDTPQRGFSYMSDGVLDMRMDGKASFSAKELVNTYSKEELERVFFEYGEEKYSRSIASLIVESREKKPIETTYELVQIIKNAMPVKALKEKQHPAKRVFQAIRIEINDELNQLEKLLTEIIDYIKPGGRIAVITFHSLEDKLVKKIFAGFEKPCTCPPDFPVCVCGKVSLGKAMKVIYPTEDEIKANPRSRSAKLRIFMKEKAK